ncbi:MAG: hypothetical protein ABSH53_06185 [Holophaga sp.]
MLKRLFRPLGLGTAAALVAVVSAQAASEFEPGLSYWAARGKLFRPSGIAALGEGRLVVQDLVEGAWMLLDLQVDGPGGSGSPGWQLGICPQFPTDVAGLFSGHQGRFLVLHRGGDLSRCEVLAGDQGQSFLTQRKVLDADLRAKAGVGSAAPVSCAERPDGSLVLGYATGVLLVEPAPGADREGKAPQSAVEASCRWLAGRAPEPADLAGAGTRGPVVAVDPQGRILVLGRQTRSLIRIDLGTLKEETLVGPDRWPCEGFIPDDALPWGDTLFVAGFPKGRALRTLVAVEPAQDPPGAFRARFVGIGMETEGPFAVTPAGHLAVVEPTEKGIRMIRNAKAPGEIALGAKPDGPDPDPALEGMLAFLKAAADRLPEKPPARAKTERKKPRPEPPPKPTAEDEARAAQAYAALMAEESAEARKQAKRDKRKAKKQKDRAPAPGTVTPAVAPAQAATPKTSAPTVPAAAVSVVARPASTLSAPPVQVRAGKADAPPSAPDPDGPFVTVTRRRPGAAGGPDRPLRRWAPAGGGPADRGVRGRNPIHRRLRDLGGRPEAALGPGRDRGQAAGGQKSVRLAYPRRGHQEGGPHPAAAGNRPRGAGPVRPGPRDPGTGGGVDAAGGRPGQPGSGAQGLVPGRVPGAPPVQLRNVCKLPGHGPGHPGDPRPQGQRPAHRRHRRRRRGPGAGGLGGHHRLPHRQGRHGPVRLRPDRGPGRGLAVPGVHPARGRRQSAARTRRGRRIPRPGPPGPGRAPPGHLHRAPDGPGPGAAQDSLQAQPERTGVRHAGRLSRCLRGEC